MLAILSLQPQTQPWSKIFLQEITSILGKKIKSQFTWLYTDLWLSKYSKNRLFPRQALQLFSDTLFFSKPSKLEAVIWFRFRSTRVTSSWKNLTSDAHLSNTAFTARRDSARPSREIEDSHCGTPQPCRSLCVSGRQRLTLFGHRNWGTA